MDFQKRIKQCERCTNRIIHRIQIGDITVAGLKAALFNLNRHIVYLEKEVAEKGVAKAVDFAKEIINSSRVQDILTGKTPIIRRQQTIKTPLSKKKKLYNPQADYLEWRDKASLEGYRVYGTASEAIRQAKGKSKIR